MRVTWPRKLSEHHELCGFQLARYLLSNFLQALVM